MSTGLINMAEAGSLLGLSLSRVQALANEGRFGEVTRTTRVNHSPTGRANTSQILLVPREGVQAERERRRLVQAARENRRHDQAQRAQRNHPAPRPKPEAVAQAPSASAEREAKVAEPAATEPAATEPAATEPTATEPTAIEPVAIEPVASDTFSTYEAAEILGLSKSSVGNLASRGKIPGAYRAIAPGRGRVWRIPRKAVETMKAHRERDRLRAEADRIAKEAPPRLGPRQVAGIVFDVDTTAAVLPEGSPEAWAVVKALSLPDTQADAEQLRDSEQGQELRAWLTEKVAA